MKKNIAVIILAAGRGERMKSSLPKVLHPLCGRPMLGYVLDLVRGLRIKKTIAVLGHKYQEVKKFLPDGVKVVVQKQLLGSADAVRQAEGMLRGFRGTVLILYADNPLLKKETLGKLMRSHFANNADATLLTTKVKEPKGYGRILRDKFGAISRIVEEKDADAYEKDIKEINVGCACFNSVGLFVALRKVRRNNQKKEYYLTDVVDILYRAGRRIEAVNLADSEEGLGINSRLELAKANRVMQERILSQHMHNGVAIVDPQTTFINWGTKIAADTTIYPFTVIESNVKIGNRCFIGPFCHLRSETTIKDNIVVGNFTELVRCDIGSRTLIKHFGYLGDSRVGSDVNVGAGVVTANFDGIKKNRTTVKDKAFLGSDTILVAPNVIGKGAVTGAGSVVTKNKKVSDYSVVAGVPAVTIKKRG